MISVFTLKKNESFSIVSRSTSSHLYLGHSPPDLSTLISPSSRDDCCTWRLPCPFFYRNSMQTQPFSLAAFLRPF